jgi:hypothetical protein
MHDVSGYTKKDGTRVGRYRRRNPRRGNKGGGKKVTGAVVIILTVGGIATTVTISETTGISASKPRAAKRARSSNTAVSAEAQAGFRRAEAALSASGYKTNLVMKFGNDCAAHSYGRVHEFFRSHPCEWLARAYLQLDGFEVLVAISWVGMPNASLAKRYKDLIDTPGAGNITELSRDTTLYRKIQYTDATYMSSINGNAVWNVQVKPVFPTSIGDVNKILDNSRPT